MSEIFLSIIVPIYNEQDVLPHLYQRLINVLEPAGFLYEVIFIDDGSRDQSLPLLVNYHNDNHNVKVVSFSRNFGHQVAITAGINYAQGKAVMIIDGDLQDPPEIIPEFIAMWKQGYEVVYGIRKKRKENFVKKMFYSTYYRLLKKLSNTDIPLDSGDCCLIDRRIVDLMNKMPERNRFVRGLRAWLGFKQIGLAYERDRRFAGKVKYSFIKLIKLGLDGIISFSYFPLKISVFLGFFISISSVIYSFYIVVNRFIHPEQRILGWASIVVGITFLGGIQLLMMGVLGEYVSRIFDEVKNRPHYVIGCTLGLEDRNAQNISYHPGV
ncbi:MAG: glycosyltransferase family 2 protein [Candidatus Omnitrophica bacterium]|nr:glycosyltransferase family 2 protein [Candidatus Omnitrophota bacterium]